MMKPWFNIRKAAQVAAFFARQEGDSINVLKLVKLLYLADRLNMEKYDFPILGDQLVSMDHGPVNSITFDYINGCQIDRDGWDEFINDRDCYSVGLVNDISDDSLDELSVAELETLYDTWKQFGQLSKYEIRDWTHENCPEWEDPNGSSYPIPYERVFKFLGKPDASGLAEKIRSERSICEAFAYFQ